MARRLLTPSTSLLRPRPSARMADAVVAQRIRAVLETRPGDIPWRPDFGCNLGRFVDQPLTPEAVSGVRNEIRRALSRHLPDVRVRDVKVGVLTGLGAHGMRGLRQLPIAERALVQLGTHATLDVDLEVSVDGRVVFLEARIQP